MQPLSGIKVLDFSRYIAGPLCTMYLAEWGADVIKVEDPRKGDDSRTWAPFKNGISGYFSAFNRNKKSITVDLKKDEGLNIIHELVKSSDVVICNFSPGVTDRLGIGYKTLSEIKPDLIYCDISGFGQEGPYKKRKGFDTIFQAMGGIMSLTGTGNGEPVKAGVPIGDYSGAFFASMSILVSLFQRERTGKGEYIDISLLDSVVNLLPLAFAFYHFTGQGPKPKGTEHPGRVPSSSFKAKDGKYVQISVTDVQWFEFSRIIEIPNEIAHSEKFSTNNMRVKNRQESIEIIQNAILQFTQEEMVRNCSNKGIPCGPVNTLTDILNDPQLNFREVFSSTPHDELGELNHIHFPAKFLTADLQKASNPPRLGEHTEQILTELLNYTNEEIDKLRKNQSI